MALSKTSFPEAVHAQTEPVPPVRLPHTLLLWISLLLIPVSLLSLKIDLADMSRYPGIDLLPKIAGARRMAAGLDPYEVDGQANANPYFASNQIPYNTPFAFILYMPLRSLPYLLQRKLYYGLGLLWAVASLGLLIAACRGTQQRQVCWIVFALWIVCSYSTRLELERGQYYLLLLCLVCAAAVSLRNRWEGWLGCVPVAMLVLIRPTYGLMLVTALICLGARKWTLRVATLALVGFAVTLPFGGVARWMQFESAVKAHQASILSALPSSCSNQTGMTQGPSTPQMIGQIDFSRELLTHSVTGTYIGLSIIRWGVLSPHLALLCGFPSPQWIWRINQVLLALAIAGGAMLCAIARRRRVSRPLLIAFSLLWPILAEIFGPERNLYTAVLEAAPLLFVLLDWDGPAPKTARGPGAGSWWLLLALAAVPTIAYQLVDKLAVREAMSILILLALPFGLAGYCLWKIVASPVNAAPLHGEGRL